MRRFDTYLPFVPSRQEVITFISTMTDIKHKAMTALMYSSGLRIGEVCRLRYEDIQRKNMRIHITHGKNRCDRYAILSKAALDILTQYWFECGRPTGWLFPKQTDPSRPIDTFFLSRHIAAHEKELGWPKRLTCHSFRHAFGTHLYENGADRQNNDLGRFFNPHHPAVLRLLKMVCDNAHKNGVWVGICGELGADLELTETFLSIGIDELSVSPRSVLPLRQKIREVDASAVQDKILADLLGDENAI